jgi:cytochrome c553
MRKLYVLLLVCGAALCSNGTLVSAAGMPLWAYGYITPPPATSDYSSKCTPEKPVACARGGLPTQDVSKRSIPGSTGEFTVPQIHNDFGPADWFPGDHPTMPDIVAHGREKDGIRACGLCHFPNGQGKPENAPVAGTSASYVLQQLADFKNGSRRTSDKNKANGFEMGAMAAALTEAEKTAVAEYFSAIRFKPWVKVVEAAQIPEVAAGVNGLFMPVKGGKMIPLGKRLIEVPENPDETLFNRNPRSGFIAYVPPGTLARGKMLATTGGNGRTQRCDTCHGADLRGIGPVPAIAGRQASYLSRQMYDMQVGTRHGLWSELMTPVVAKLTEDDILALAAYSASQAP